VRGHRWSRALLSVLAAGLLAQPVGATGTTPGAAAAVEAEPVRIMLFGDSITQGSTGDWTWRYRLWQTLTAEGVDFDFVGPRDDLVTYVSTSFGNRHYKDPAFDTDHAAVWGKQLTGDGFTLSGAAGDYRPDIIVCLIGINDIRNAVSLDVLQRRWWDEIARTRAVVPDVDILLVPLPYTWVPGVPEYNAKLAELAESLDGTLSRVVVTPRARFGSNDAYDWLHPSAVGERKYAAVVAEGLAGLGVGQGARAIADPVLTERWAPGPTASVSGTEITVEWPLVGYATREHIRVVDRTEPTTEIVRFVRGTSYVITGKRGHTYRIRLCPVKGHLATGPVSRATQITVP